MKDFVLKNDTLFEHGDIRTGNSDDQHKRHLLLCAKGSFKEFPTSTVGLIDFLEDEDFSELIREIRIKFTNDGMTINKIKITDNLEVDANY